MLGRGQAADGGGVRVRSGSRAGVVYRGASWFDCRESVGGSLREEDRRSLAFGSSSGGGRCRNGLCSGLCECTAGAGIRGRLSTERGGVGATGGRKGGWPGSGLGSRRCSAEA